MLSTDAMLHVFLFGHLHARLDGVPLAPSGRQQTERLWVYLLLRGAGMVPRHEAAAELWPNDPRGVARLRFHLYHLREHLPDAEPGAPWLAATRSHVRWNPAAASWVDVHAFAEACARLEASAAPPAPEEIEQALALRARPLLEGWDAPWIARARDDIEARYVGLMERLAVSRQRAGDLAGALGAAARLLEHDRLREETYRLLMRLHAAAGDRAAALHHFDVCRHVLAAELGADPAAETSALARDLRAVSPPAGEPPAARRASEAAPAGRRGRPHNLPPAGPRLVGRWRAQEARRLLAEARLLTLTGPPGVGKSLVARSAARAFAGAPGGGVWCVDLGGAPEGAPIDALVAAAIGVGAPAGGRGGAAALAERLGGADILLVLDNAEQVIDACAALAQALLSQCPSARMLVTSRERMAIDGETVWAVPLLDLPDPRRPASIRHAPEAARLFVERAWPGDPRATADPGRWAAVAAICRRLDGLPEAVERAARFAAAHGLDRLAAALDDCVPLLDHGGPIGLARYATLTASLDESYRRLTMPERDLLERLAGFEHGFSGSMVEGLYGDDAAAPDVAPLDLLDRLAAKSLILTGAGPAPAAPHRLLEVLRQYLGRRGEGGRSREIGLPGG